MTWGPPFPRLTADNHHVTSPATPDYNCVAWAASDTGRWWEPGVHRPTPVEGYGADVSEQAFRAIGYEPCSDGALEVGFDKVALYASGPFHTHAARQLPSGKWTSKLGKAEDIEHETAEDVAGGVYGDVVRFMRRPTQTAG